MAFYSEIPTVSLSPAVSILGEAMGPTPGFNLPIQDVPADKMVGYKCSS